MPTGSDMLVIGGIVTIAFCVLQAEATQSYIALSLGAF